MRAAFAFLSLFCALLFPVRAAAAPVAVTVSIPPQKYFVRHIGGDAVTVTVMAAGGRDPHTYEPTAAQMEGIAKAELYFTIGVPFETQWVPKFLSLNPSMRVVDLLGAIPRIEGKPDLALRDALPGKGRHRHGARGRHGLDADDPHAWLSPDDMILTVPLMVASLGEKRPDRAAEFQRRGAELTKTLAELSLRIRGLLDKATTRTFLTFHQSWAHYARNFGLREASVEMGGREPGPKSMAMLMDFARANAIGAIVADSMTGRSSVKAIANAIAARVIYADSLAEDWPGALLEFSAKLADALGAPR
jgi:zinc transport system substrate-binding protein